MSRVQEELNDNVYETRPYEEEVGVVPYLRKVLGKSTFVQLNIVVYERVQDAGCEQIVPNYSVLLMRVWILAKYLLHEYAQRKHVEHMHRAAEGVKLPREVVPAVFDDLYDWPRLK